VNAKGNAKGNVSRLCPELAAKRRHSGRRNNSIDAPFAAAGANGGRIRSARAAARFPSSEESCWFTGIAINAPSSRTSSRALSGRTGIHHARERALLGRDLAANDQREDYLRARLEVREDGALIAMPVNQQDSSLLGNLAAARALLIRPPFAPAAAKGASIELLRLPE
jgi:hypothetical protein